MAARRIPALALPVDPGAGVSFLGYENRTPLLTIATGRPALLVTLTLPEHLEAGHVDFARQLAAKAWAYSVAVERRYRGLPLLPEAPVPYTLTAKAEALLDASAGTGGPGAAARWPGGDGMTATVTVRFDDSGQATVQSYVRLTASTHIQCSPTTTPRPSCPSTTARPTSRSPTPVRARSPTTT